MFDVFGDGEDLVITRNGERIAIYPDSEKICEFLEWCADQVDSKFESFRSPQGSRYFCTKTVGRLLEILRDNGLMLFRDFRQAHHVETNDDRGVGNARFTQLSIAGPEDRDITLYSTDYGLQSMPSNLWVSHDLRNELNDRILEEDDEVRKLTLWPVTRSFVYFDISDFSQLETGMQALVINTLGVISGRKENWRTCDLEESAFADLENALCIGDGYIYCFISLVYATYYAARLANKIEYLVAKREIFEFHFRIGVHIGPVFRFWDFGRPGWNYVGEGINDGSRVLSAIGKGTDDVVFVSNEIRNHLLEWEEDDRPTPFDQLLDAMQNRGRRQDKHKKMRRVYELNHAAVKPV